MPHPSLLADTAAVITIALGVIGLIGSAVGCCRWMRNRINEAAGKLLQAGAETHAHLTRVDEHLLQQDHEISTFRADVTTRLEGVERRQESTERRQLDREQDMRQITTAVGTQSEMMRGVAGKVDGMSERMTAGFAAHGARLDRLEDDMRRIATGPRG